MLCHFKTLQDRGLFFQGRRVQTQPYLSTIMQMGGTTLDVLSLLSSIVLAQTAPAAGERKEHVSGSSPLAEGWAGWREAAREGSLAAGAFVHSPCFVMEILRVLQRLHWRCFS